MKKNFVYAFLCTVLLPLSGGEILFKADFQKKDSGGTFDQSKWKKYGEVQITDQGVATLPSKSKGWSDYIAKTGLEKLPSPEQGTLVVSWSMIPNAADSRGHKGLASRFIFGNAFAADLASGYAPRLNDKVIVSKKVKHGKVCTMSVTLNSKQILSWKVNGVEALKKPCPLFKGEKCHSITLRDFSAHNVKTVWLGCSIEKVPAAKK